MSSQAGVGLRFGQLLRLANRPSLFAPHEAPFWDDPYISQQMLKAHLDPTTDAASRRPETIERTVEWLISSLHLTKGQRVLDLGCGPGLYCARLSQRGLVVTGMDFSASSIAYARQEASANNLPIEYVCRDYLTLDAIAAFDAIFLIYFDFGVLPNDQRDELLRRIRLGLRPGGRFVFDVKTPRHPTPPDGTRTWQICESGFWRPTPYLELTEYFRYPEADVNLRQTIVVDADGTATAYRIWEHYYSASPIASVLDAAGFTVQEIHADLTGPPYDDSSISMGVIARPKLL